MNNFISEFGLTFKQTCLLFSLERQIVVDDILYSKVHGKEDTEKKQEWLTEWEKNINNFLNNLGEEHNTLVKIEDVNPEIILQKIMNENKELNIWKYLILLECVLFNPYYPISDEKSDLNEKAKTFFEGDFYEKITKLFKGLSLNEDNQKLSLGKIAALLDIETKYIDEFKNSYNKSIKSLSGFWTKSLIGTGTGMLVGAAVILVCMSPIAALFAGPGLYGAAAFSAGMAALGGGSIAAGGFGVAGGIAVLVGGALVLGGGTGAATTIGLLAAVSPKVILTELAKMEVVLKEIVLAIQKDTKLLQEIILQLQNNMNEMQKEVIKLKLEDKKNKEKIKNLEEAIEYLKKAITDFSNMN